MGVLRGVVQVKKHHLPRLLGTYLGSRGYIVPGCFSEARCSVGPRCVDRIRMGLGVCGVRGRTRPHDLLSRCLPPSLSLPTSTCLPTRSIDGPGLVTM